jgi:hypothetical protein
MRNDEFITPGFGKRQRRTVRVGKVARIRRELESGTYDERGKLNACVDRIHQAIKERA